MAKGLFITATGTDVGKTYCTALIVKKLRDAGMRAGYYKAALSGAEGTAQGLLPGDADHVNRIAGIGADPRTLVSYVYEHAVSPHLAAQIEGHPVELSRVKEDYENICAQFDYVTVEGSGGIVCPIRYDDQAHLFLEDIIRELGLGSLIVADAGLGTINAVVLTVEYMRSRGLPIRGILFNRFHAGDRMEADNRKMVEALTGIPVLACVAENAVELDMDAAALAALYDESRNL